MAAHTEGAAAELYLGLQRPRVRKGSRHKSLLSLFLCHQIIVCIIYYEWPYGIITAQQIHINRCTDTEQRQSHVRDAGMPQCDVWSSSPPPTTNPTGHLQLSISCKTDRGNESWGIYLPCWHCFCLVSSELTHLLKCWVETSTYYRAGLLSKDCVLCVL